MSKALRIASFAGVLAVSSSLGVADAVKLNMFPVLVTTQKDGGEGYARPKNQQAVIKTPILVIDSATGVTLPNVFGFIDPATENEKAIGFKFNDASDPDYVETPRATLDDELLAQTLEDQTGGLTRPVTAPADMEGAVPTRITSPLLTAGGRRYTYNGPGTQSQSHSDPLPSRPLGAISSRATARARLVDSNNPYHPYHDDIRSEMQTRESPRAWESEEEADDQEIYERIADALHEQKYEAMQERMKIPSDLIASRDERERLYNSTHVRRAGFLEQLTRNLFKKKIHPI